MHLSSIVTEIMVANIFMSMYNYQSPFLNTLSTGILFYIMKEMIINIQLYYLH